MTFEPFAAAWQRWDRAQVHLSEGIGAWIAHIDDHNAFDFWLDGDGTGTYVLLVRQVRDVAPGLPVALGEWLYNLRASGTVKRGCVPGGAGVE